MSYQTRLSTTKEVILVEISNISEIFDNGEFVTIVTETGSVVHLPKAKHSIVVHDRVETSICIVVTVELNKG